MASSTSGLKGNPASKRIGNVNHKATRARSWARNEKRKEARRAAQDAAHTRNVERGFTTWSEAKAKRAAGRAS